MSLLVGLLLLVAIFTVLSLMGGDSKGHRNHKRSSTDYDSSADYDCGGDDE